MVKIFRFVSLYFLFISGLTLAQEVKVHHDDSVDFSKYRTFAWSPSDSLPLVLAAIPPEEAVDAKEVDARIRQEMEKRLKSAGLHKEAEANLLVSYSGIVRFRLDTGSQGRDRSTVRYGDWRNAAGKMDPYLSIEGILKVEMRDVQTNQVIWRASATDVVKKPKDVIKRFDRMVKKLLQKFPPK